MTSNTNLPSCGILGIGMCFGDTTFEPTFSAGPKVLRNKTDHYQSLIMHITETDLQISHYFT